MPEPAAVKENTELKPCPFCGQQPSVNRAMAVGEWLIDCCWSTVIEDSQGEAIAAWNTRKPAASPVAGVSGRIAEIESRLAAEMRKYPIALLAYDAAYLLRLVTGELAQPSAEGDGYRCYHCKRVFPEGTDHFGKYEELPKCLEYKKGLWGGVHSAYIHVRKDVYAAMEKVAEGDGDQMKTEVETVTDLLDRFVEVYGKVPLQGSMQEPGMQLWRDYYAWTGDHMILSDEGWEPGAVKQSYLDEYGPGAILDEVNAPLPAPVAKEGRES